MAHMQTACQANKRETLCTKPKHNPDLPVKYVSLLSSSYSGSTLLSLLLAESRIGITGFGDTYPLPGNDYSKEKCTCGAYIPECPFRLELEERMRQWGYSDWRWVRSEPFPHRRVLHRLHIRKRVLPLYRAMPSRIRQNLFAAFFRETDCFLHCLYEMTGCGYYLDGCKSLIRLEVLRTHLEDNKVIHLVKDPRAYVHSMLKRNKNSLGLRRIVDNWIDYNRKASQFRDMLGAENYCLVRYEDLSRDTAGALRNVCAFLNLPVKYPGDISDAELGDVHIIGNRMRLSFRSVEDRSEDWRTKLDPKISDYVTERVSSLGWYTVSN